MGNHIQKSFRTTLFFNQFSVMTDHGHLSLYNQYVNISAGWQDIEDTTVLEYVWLDGSGITLRSKCRSVPGKVDSLDQCPEWNYDGSSCYQAETDNSEVIMRPVAMFNC